MSHNWTKIAFWNDTLKYTLLGFLGISTKGKGTNSVQFVLQFYPCNNEYYCTVYYFFILRADSQQFVIPGPGLTNRNAVVSPCCVLCFYEHYEHLPHIWSDKIWHMIE